MGVIDKTKMTCFPTLLSQKPNNSQYSGVNCTKIDKIEAISLHDSEKGCSFGLIHGRWTIITAAAYQSDTGDPRQVFENDGDLKRCWCSVTKSVQK